MTSGTSEDVRRFRGVWHAMRNRCQNKNTKDYPRYGGRGIRVLWKDFSEFKSDMWLAYLDHKEKHTTTTIERKNNNGNYSKGNCIWATREEQVRNKVKHYGGGTRHHQYGIPVAPDVKEKISRRVKELWRLGMYKNRINGMTGKLAWNAGRSGCFSLEARMKMSLAKKGNKNAKRYKESK